MRIILNTKKILNFFEENINNLTYQKMLKNMLFRSLKFFQKLKF
jgi:hypothetical protein